MLLAVGAADGHILMKQIKFIVEDVISCIVIVGHLLFSVSNLLGSQGCILFYNSGKTGIIIRLDTEIGKILQIMLQILQFQIENFFRGIDLVGDGQVSGGGVIFIDEIAGYQRGDQNHKYS